METLAYHFNLILTFDKDINIEKLERLIGIKAYKKIHLKDSLFGEDNKKTAKIWFKSEDFSNLNTFETIEKYLLNIKENFKDISHILKEFSGEFAFQLVFNKINERPIIEFSTKNIEILQQIGASFSVDFI